LNFFLLKKIREQEGRTGPTGVWGGVGTSGSGEGLEKEEKEGDYGTKMCIHVYKCKNDT
jgi:hypothetical protein